MSTIEELIERKSVRKFKDTAISNEIKNQILIASTNAPSAGCQQLYTILDITDEKVKKELSILCDNQPFICDAKMVLVYLADCKKWYEGFNSTNSSPRKPGVGDLLLACSDANIAAQNAVVAAHSLGIGSCYIGDVMENCEKMRDLLHLPRYVFPACMVVFGYPEDDQFTRTKPKRASLDKIVCQNYYPEMDDEYLKALFEKEDSPISYEEWMQRFCQRKYNSNFAKEMTNSVATYLRDFKVE